MDKRKWKDRQEVLARIYMENRISGDNRPDSTINALVEGMGAEEARKAVAELVGAISPYDGRISGPVRIWARSVTGLTPADYQVAGIYSADQIHPAHVEQLAWAAMKI